MWSETGGILLSPRPAPDDSPVKPEYPTRPFFGVKPVLLDEKVLCKNRTILHSLQNRRYFLRFSGKRGA